MITLLEAAIRELDVRITKSDESESMKEVYRRIKTKYQAEIDYLDEILWEGEEINND